VLNCQFFRHKWLFSNVSGIFIPVFARFKNPRKTTPAEELHSIGINLTRCYRENANDACGMPIFGDFSPFSGFVSTRARITLPYSITGNAKNPKPGVDFLSNLTRLEYSSPRARKEIREEPGLPIRKTRGCFSSVRSAPNAVTLALQNRRSAELDHAREFWTGRGRFPSAQQRQAALRATS
jgi:hypothetical protein